MESEKTGEEKMGKLKFKLYNTKTKKKEVFKPIVEGKVGIYVCGITSYDFSHIGHARAYVAFDILIRYLKHIGYKKEDVVYVRNFTDIDDKIINAARKRGVDYEELSKEFREEFKRDMDDLQCLPPTHQPRVTKHMDKIIEMIEQIMKNGGAYEPEVPDGNVYFRVDSFPNYGKLSGRYNKLVDNRPGARVEVDDKKKKPADFALWKAAKPGEPEWKSPWGYGRPGWHIECSAMSAHFLGHAFDIHGGGMDLIFPHHENEIAQSCVACSKSETQISYWMHNGFVTTNDEKMSKSVGNFFTIREVTKLYHPLALRYFLLGTHYRSPVNYSISQIQIASKAVFNTYQTLQECEKALGLTEENEATGEAAGRINLEAEICLNKSNECEIELHNAFEMQMADDLHTPSILNAAPFLTKKKEKKKNAALPEALKSLNNSINVLKNKSRRELQKSIKRSVGALQKKVVEVLDVLGLLSSLPYTEVLEQLKEKALTRAELTEEEVSSFINERKKAREVGDYLKSDQIRNELAAKGITLMDVENETEWMPCVPVPQKQ